MRFRGGLIVLALLFTACSSPAAVSPAASGAAQPASPARAADAGPEAIRLGHGFAAEEQLWLMGIRPDLTPNQGTAYTLQLTAFRGPTDRLNAYEAGQLDGGTNVAPTALFAAEQGLPFKLVASIVRESPNNGFNTTYLSLADSEIQGPRDLRGKTVGIVDFKSATDLWARAAVEGAGLNPDTDVTYVIVPFPAMGEALRSKKIDVGTFPQPFYEIEQRRGGVRTVFISKTGVPFDEELDMLFLRPAFIQQHPAAVRAFLADFVAATRWYLANGPEARQALIDAKIVQTAPELYVELADYNREPTARIAVDSLKQLQELHLKLGWQTKRLNIDDLVDQSLLPERGQ